MTLVIKTLTSKLFNNKTGWRLKTIAQKDQVIKLIRNQLKKYLNYYLIESSIKIHSWVSLCLSSIFRSVGTQLLYLFVFPSICLFFFLSVPKFSDLNGINPAEFGHVFSTYNWKCEHHSVLNGSQILIKWGKINR